MTINELIKQLQTMNVDGNQQIRVAAMGGMRHGKDINKITIGFDWDNGAILLHPTIPLTIKGSKNNCGHTSTHWRINPTEPHIGRSIEVCNECGLSRSHWEQGISGWVNADIDDFPLFVVPTKSK